MSTIVINKTAQIIREYKGQRVITFKDIDTLHGRPTNTARRNFNTNKGRFIEGVDFFVRNSYEAKKEYDITAPNGMIVLTESGYLMLAKSLTDDLSWKVQRELVNNYFRSKEAGEQRYEQMKLEEKPYEYFDKTWHGEPVLTSHDFEHFSGCRRDSVSRHCRNYLNSSTDYVIIEGLQISEFKRENPKYMCYNTKLLLIRKSGFEKLCKVLRLSVDNPLGFIIETAKPVEEKKKTEYAVVIGRTHIQEQIRKIKKQMAAVDVLLNKYERHNVKIDDMDAIRSVLRDVGMEMSCEINGLVREKVMTTTEYRL